MAAFREHIAFSSLLGVGYGTVAVSLLGYGPSEALLAGFLTGVGGMLPDLDSPTGKPGQEVFALTAAVAPLVLVGHILKVSGLPTDTETVMLIMLVMYFSIRHGLAWFVKRVSVHRGMFHSIPAMGIAAELTYLAYPSQHLSIKLLMGCGVALGFLSHLVLDEYYSIRWNGPLPQVKKSFGTALKFVGKTFTPNLVTYTLLLTITLLICEDAGIIGPPIDHDAPTAKASNEFSEPSNLLPETMAKPQSIQEAMRYQDELSDAPLYK